MNTKEKENKCKWNEMKWQIEYTGVVTDVISPKQGCPVVHAVGGN